MVHVFFNQVLISISPSLSNCDSIRDVSACSLTRSCNFHDLSSLNAEVFGNSVFALDLWQLVLLDSVLLQQLIFLLFVQQFVLRDQMMVRNIHLNIVKRNYFWIDVESLFFLTCERRHIINNDNNSLTTNRDNFLLDEIH